jgi:hypothetical protein
MQVTEQCNQLRMGVWWFIFFLSSLYHCLRQVWNKIVYNLEIYNTSYLEKYGRVGKRREVAYEKP